MVPAANDQSELAPVVKSVLRVEPKAGSEGHVAVKELEEDEARRKEGVGVEELTLVQRVAAGEGLRVDDLKACQQDGCSGKSRMHLDNVRCVVVIVIVVVVAVGSQSKEKRE